LCLIARIGLLKNGNRVSAQPATQLGRLGKTGSQVARSMSMYRIILRYKRLRRIRAPR
jgi:hypothetical protein